MPEFGKYQQDVDRLGSLEKYRYENIFKVYEQGDKNFFYYNVLKTLKLPGELNEQLFDNVTYNGQMPITTLSYSLYGTTYLWWLIMIVNGIKNPRKIESGRSLRVVKGKFLKPVLDSIKVQLQ